MGERLAVAASLSLRQRENDDKMDDDNDEYGMVEASEDFTFEQSLAEPVVPLSSSDDDFPCITDLESGAMEDAPGIDDDDDIELGAMIVNQNSLQPDSEIPDDS